jgi:archaellum component FlaC
MGLRDSFSKISGQAKEHINNAKNAAQDIMGKERAENVQSAGVENPEEVSSAMRAAEEEETEVVEEMKWMEQEIIEALHYDEKELQALMQAERKRAEREHEASQALHKMHEGIVTFNQRLSEIVGQLDDRIEGKLEDRGHASVYRGGDLGQMKTEKLGHNWQKVVRDGAENIQSLANRELGNVKRIDEEDIQVEEEVEKDFQEFKAEWEQTLDLLKQQEQVMENWQVNDAQLKSMAEEAAKSQGDVAQVKQNLEQLVDKEESLSEKMTALFSEAEQEEGSIIETVEQELEKMEMVEEQMEQDQRNAIQDAKEIVQAIEGEGGLENDLEFLRGLMEREDVSFKSADTFRQELESLEQVIMSIDEVLNEALQILEEEIQGEEQLESRIEASAEEGTQVSSALS